MDNDDGGDPSNARPLVLSTLGPIAPSDMVVVTFRIIS